MKYFLDTEFIERPGSIQLVSIGIVSENDRTFYAESISFDERKANDWVKENVLSKLRWWKPYDFYRDGCHNDTQPQTVVDSLDESIEMFGEIDSIKTGLLWYFDNDPSPEFWGYLAGYDWVVFCWIFGEMSDLPEGFPMYCNDIEQLMVEHGVTTKVKQESGTEHNALADALWNKRQYHEVIGQKIGFKKSPVE